MKGYKKKNTNMNRDFAKKHERTKGYKMRFGQSIEKKKRPHRDTCRHIEN